MRYTVTMEFDNPHDLIEFMSGKPSRVAVPKAAPTPEPDTDEAEDEPAPRKGPGKLKVSTGGAAKKAAKKSAVEEEDDTDEGEEEEEEAPAPKRKRSILDDDDEDGKDVAPRKTREELRAESSRFIEKYGEDKFVELMETKFGTYKLKEIEDDKVNEAWGALMFYGSKPAKKAKD